MLNYSINNINKTSYYILDNKNSLNISMTPFLFCSRNSIFLLDVLKHVFLLKKSLYFFEKVFLERNRVVFLLENKEINSLEINNYMNKYKNSILSFLSNRRYKRSIKYSKFFIKTLINLKKNLSNFKINSNNSLFNLNYFKIKAYFFLYINYIISNTKTVLTSLTKLETKFFSDYIYIYRLLVKYNVQKYIKIFFYKNLKNLVSLNSYRFLLGKFKNYSLNIKKSFNLNKIINGRFFNLYEVNFKIFFKFYSYMVKLKKWIIFFKKNLNKIYNKKYLYLKSYLKLLNINILNFYKHKNMLYSIMTSNFTNFDGSFYKILLFTYKYKFMESRFNFWFSSWLNGGITNFYGLKKTYKSKNEEFKKIRYLPDFIVYFNLEKRDSFLSELFLYEIPSIGFSSLDMNPFFFTYFIPSNNKNFLLFEFYFNLFLESSFRSLISDSKYFI